MVGGMMYSLLGISQSVHFVDGDKQSQELKKNIINYTQQKKQNQQVERKIHDRTRGWNKVLYHKCNNNQLYNF